MIVEASLTGLLRTLFIIILVILAIRILLRILAPYMMRFFLNKVSERVQKEFERTQNQYQQYQNSTSDAQQTIINKNPHSKNPQATKQVGDYIDFEEI
nr:DUF4834 family protein [uncultured Capnocytophaga sp.]